MTAATSCDPSEPPVTSGVLGAVRSRRTVEALSTVDQAPVLPATSNARNCTVVVPSPPTGRVPPIWGAVHVPPPSVDARCS
ncbi:MAG: hypothetical protein U0Y82_05925 [Thermoleophilia bacterium]